jgi:2-iminobutanoate/2-iminopropanoate deaminase
VVAAGMLGRRDGPLVEGFEPQLRQACDNLESLLATEGCTQADVVRLVVYLTDIEHMDTLNLVFSERFSEPRPVRTTVVVAGLPGGALVELEATAHQGNS